MHFHKDPGKTHKLLFFINILAKAGSVVSHPFVCNNILGATFIFNIFLCETSLPDSHRRIVRLHCPQRSPEGRAIPAQASKLRMNGRSLAKGQSPRRRQEYHPMVRGEALRVGASDLWNSTNPSQPRPRTLWVAICRFTAPTDRPTRTGFRPSAHPCRLAQRAEVCQ